MTPPRPPEEFVRLSQELGRIVLNALNRYESPEAEVSAWLSHVVAEREAAVWEEAAKDTEHMATALTHGHEAREQLRRLARGFIESAATIRRERS